MDNKFLHWMFHYRGKGISIKHNSTMGSYPFDACESIFDRKTKQIHKRFVWKGQCPSSAAVNILILLSQKRFQIRMFYWFNIMLLQLCCHRNVIWNISSWHHLCLSMHSFRNYERLCRTVWYTALLLSFSAYPQQDCRATNGLSTASTK